MCFSVGIWRLKQIEKQKLREKNVDFMVNFNIIWKN